MTLLPTPRTSDTNGAGTHGQGGPDLRTVVDSLLPTPAARDWKDNKVKPAAHRPDDVDNLNRAIAHLLRATDGTKGGPNQRGSSGDPMLPSAVQLLPTPRATQAGYADDGRGGKSLDVEARRHLLPTPSADFRDRSEATGNSKLNVTRDFVDLGSVAATNRWGDYAPAIARWEHILGRPAPAPTEPGPKGSPRLSPAFVEWLMGLPEGHVTGVDIPRNAQLKALGNGVVPQQAAAAARWWLAQIQETAA